MFKAYISVFFEQINIAEFASSPLSRHIRKAIASPCAHSYRVWEPYISVHKIIQYTTCKNASHATTLENEP